MSVNGTPVASVTDSPFQTGILALIAGANSSNAPDAVASFDNLVIRAP